MAEFDTAKGAFLLVAMIIATMMVVILIGMLSCSYLAISGTPPSAVCDPELKEFAKELITMSFTAAIAFAGGRLSAPHVPPPKLPRKDKTP